MSSRLCVYNSVQYDEGGRKIQTDTVTVGEDEERELKISQLELNEEERIITMPSNADTIIAWATHKGNFCIEFFSLPIVMIFRIRSSYHPVHLHVGCEGRLRVLVASVPDLCILFTFQNRHKNTG